MVHMRVDAAPKIECRVESRPTERSLLPGMRHTPARIRDRANRSNPIPRLTQSHPDLKLPARLMERMAELEEPFCGGKRRPGDWSEQRTAEFPAELHHGECQRGGRGRGSFGHRGRSGRGPA